MVDWIAYGHVIQTTKDRERFGKGDIRGVIAPESANNAKEGGGLIPTFLFGIPGSGSMAVFLGGHLILAIQPGPAMVTENVDLLFTAIWSLALANIFGAGLALFLLVWFAYGVWEAREYAFLARVFPFYVSMVLVVCAVINIVMEARKAVDDASAPGSDTGGSDLGVNWEMPMAQVWRRFAFYVGVIVVLYFFIYLIGYPLSVSLFIYFFYRFVTRTKSRAAVIAGAAGLGFLALASKVLEMDWPEGLVQLPWPLG